MKIHTQRLSNLLAKKEAFPYQAQAVMAIRDLPYSAIFHEQGLGKTKIAVDLMLYWLKEKGLDTVLVVTKKQLVANWVGELSEHTFLHPRVLGPDKQKNFFVLNSLARVVVANFETLSTDKKRIELFLRSRDVGIIVDESTKLKNPESRLARDFFDLAPLFKVRTIMTGTPVANRPYDIWAQVYFLDMGKSLGTDFAAFKQATDLRNEFAQDSVGSNAFEQAVAGIYDRIREFSVRETKKTAGIVLPDKVYKTISADMAPIQKAMYNRIIRDLEVEVVRAGASVVDDEHEALKRLLRLIQVASCPRLLDESYTETPCKEVLLDQLLSDIVAAGDKCIVWSSFIENVDYFTRKFSSYSPKKIHGRLPIEVRNRAVSAFKNDEACKILFATPQAAKEGLTLTVANHVVFYDRGFNLDDYLQAQDRIHRISQKKICHVYNLMANNSIDFWVDALLEAKQQAAFLAQGDISQEQYQQVADYSFGDLIRQILSGETV